MLAQTSNGETVTIVDKIGRPGGDILVSADGRQFVQARHGINIIPLTEADAAPAEAEEEQTTEATEALTDEEKAAFEAEALAANGTSGDEDLPAVSVTPVDEAPAVEADAEASSESGDSTPAE